MEKHEAKKLIEEFHIGECGGNYYWKTTTKKFMSVGLYWPTIFSNTHKKEEACHKCQFFEERRKLVPLPLKPIQVEAPFQQWGLYFIRDINPHSLGHHIWILTTIYYFTKWIESIPTRQATETVIM